ncbi:hypothetical protein BH23CHL10_BH23CHL10_10820 [soil metagenome]
MREGQRSTGGAAGRTVPRTHRTDGGYGTAVDRWWRRAVPAPWLLIVITASVLILTGCVARESPGSPSALASRHVRASPSVPTASPRSVAPTATVPPQLPTLPGYLVSLAELRERAELARDGVEPHEAAIDELVAWADGAVDDRPRPERSLRITGTGGPFVEDARRAYGLALAFAITGDDEYADRARSTVLAWVDRTTELRNACSDSGSCQTSLIVARMVPAFVFAADLLQQADAWSESDRRALSEWLADLVLPVMPRLDNNWGDAGNLAELVITDYLGDEDGFRASLRRWERRLDLLGADGDLPEETRRGDQGMSYTQEALVYKVAAAAIAERRGIDLWEIENRDGVTLRAALDYLADYWNRPEAWPWHDDPDVPSPGPLWELAYAHWCDAVYLEIAEGRRPYGDRGNSAIRWTTLTSGTQDAECS